MLVLSKTDSLAGVRTKHWPQLEKLSSTQVVHG